MAQYITNQASVAYEYNGQSATTLSNVAGAMLTEPLSVEKVSLQSVYRYGEEITYSISFGNSGTTTLTNVTVTDDLGTYTLPAIATGVTPLSYVGPAILLIDGVYSGSIEPTVAPQSIVFSVPALAPGARAQILYRAQINAYAPLNETATILNTATVSAAGMNTPVSDNNVIEVDQYASITVTKSMSPAVVVDGDTLTYTFVISNYGNAPADNIVLRDAFDPAPQGITVQLDGVTQPTTAYTYVDGLLIYPAAGAAAPLALPAATIVQDAATGVVTLTPSSVTVTVAGVL